MQVLARTMYPASVAGARVRIAGFAGHLVERGVHVRLAPTLSAAEYDRISSRGAPTAKALAAARAAGRAMRSSAHPDVWLVYRLATPVAIPCADPSPLHVYDFDDALFLGSVGAANRRAGWLKNEQRRWQRYVRRARIVIAGNRYLADAAVAHARRVEVIPSCVDPSQQPLAVHGARDVVTIGWVGSPSTVGYVDPVVRALQRINRGRLRARLVVVGGELKDAPSFVECRPWSLKAEPSILASLDIGVMPLPDDPWTRGKCGYKLLQYFSAGVPAVASPVGVNRDIVGTDRGALVQGENGWMRALESLVGDPCARREMGAAGRRFVEREYSYQRWAPALAEILRGSALR